ncbi:MAG: Protein TolB [Phycisphaerae bacterium]|nr:Protein TolB [Phycisphaerae bacterium]
MRRLTPRQKTALFAALVMSAGPTAALAQDTLTVEGEERWFRNARQITRADMGLDRSGEAYFSPDGRRICFQAYPKGQTNYQIYVINADATGLKLISSGTGATTCAFFHPSGDRLIFASNHLDLRPAVLPPEVAEKASQAGQRNYAWSFFPGMDVFEHDFRSGQQRRLIEADGYDAECSFSPDGKQIVFSSMRDGDQEIYICDADGKNSRRITRAKGYDGGPFFSPDGKRIVYRSDRTGDGNMQIFINNLEGTEERQITHDPNVLHWCPFWHPSGKWLIFTRAEHRPNERPNYDLYLLRDDGSDMTRVTTSPRFDGLPVFSADGRQMMWTSQRGPAKESQVFVADWIGLSPTGELTARAP